MAVHRASSSSDESGARLCEVIMQSNTGAAQQVVENRTDLLDLMTLDELNNEKDDLGLTLPYLAVYYDRPDVVQYLHNRGMNFSLPCDPMNFGTPMFYAVNLKRLNVMEMLGSFGYSTNNKCDTLELRPLDHAIRLDDQHVIDFIVQKNKQENTEKELDLEKSSTEDREDLPLIEDTKLQNLASNDSVISTVDDNGNRQQNDDFKTDSSIEESTLAMP